MFHIAKAILAGNMEKPSDAALQLFYMLFHKNTGTSLSLGQKGCDGDAQKCHPVFKSSVHTEQA
jgi:hypothetical protein